jgi:protein TonB
MQPSSPRPRARRRRPVHPARFAALVLYLPPVASPTRLNTWLQNPRTRLGLALAALALIAGGLGAWLLRPDAPARPEETLYVIEDLPPPAPEPPPTPPDPAPPKPEPQVQPEEPPPPPQFGMQAEALSEAGEMSVATGNTLMTQADTVVKAPVAELPQAPEFFDQPPRILSAPQAEYPPRALDRGQEGVSRLRIEIDVNGRVTRVSVEKSGGRDFDQSAVAAAKATRFQPFTRGGKPVPMAFLKSYEFVLE